LLLLECSEGTFHFFVLNSYSCQGLARVGVSSNCSTHWCQDPHHTCPWAAVTALEHTQALPKASRNSGWFELPLLSPQLVSPAGLLQCCHSGSSLGGVGGGHFSPTRTAIIQPQYACVIMHVNKQCDIIFQLHRLFILKIVRFGNCDEKTYSHTVGKWVWQILYEAGLVSCTKISNTSFPISSLSGLNLSESEKHDLSIYTCTHVLRTFIVYYI
jgi:hypothetical protein